MLIPVRCYSCGKILANKYDYFQNELNRKKLAMNTTEDPLIININASNINSGTLNTLYGGNPWVIDISNNLYYNIFSNQGVNFSFLTNKNIYNLPVILIYF